MTDLEYKTSGLFTRFFPNSPQGEDAWREMAKQDGDAVVLSIHTKSVIAQLRAAGYTVRKAKNPKQSIDDILQEMEEMGIL